MKNSAKSTKAITKVEETKEIVSTENVNLEMLNVLNALNVSDKVKEGNKSIFKKEHCNSQSRGKCRKQFISAIGLYLLNVAHNKKALSEANLLKAKEIAKIYYSAEDNFKNASDYYTNGRGGTDVELIKMFITELNK